MAPETLEVAALVSPIRRPVAQGDFCPILTSSLSSPPPPPPPPPFSRPLSWLSSLPIASTQSTRTTGRSCGEAHGVGGIILGDKRVTVGSLVLVLLLFSRLLHLLLAGVGTPGPSPASQYDVAVKDSSADFNDGGRVARCPCISRLSECEWVAGSCAHGGGDGAEEAEVERKGEEEEKAQEEGEERGTVVVAASQDDENNTLNVDDGKAWCWRADVEASCGFRLWTRLEAMRLLRDTWIVFAGDSQIRFLLRAFLQLLLPSVEELEPQLFKRHSNFYYEIKESNIRLTFLWAPYVQDVIEQLDSVWLNVTSPQILALGASIWHMLHVSNVTGYQLSLNDLGRKLAAWYSSESGGRQQDSQPGRGVEPQAVSDYGRANEEEADENLNQELDKDRSQAAATPLFFWLNNPKLVSSLFNTEEKKVKLTKELHGAYDRALMRSPVLLPKGPCILLDYLQVSTDCGENCTTDGIHYNNATYHGLAQMVLNAFEVSQGDKGAL
ncbi:hypothetical protein CBR_g39794 [Chara braunii]|uniref:Uncharacterized protein n=1 Tax=Chara braunii TaxID=69332 RepID=A0A388LSB4_CHABU|nr:hypothetical protein CBR_g39794 [Chara braunii]|eukprot:GBG85228.1 hypothetical protein CBR_g39794 [Chara braunii]